MKYDPHVCIWFKCPWFFSVGRMCVFFTQRKFSSLLLPIGYWSNVENSHCNTRTPPLVLVIKGLWKLAFCTFEFDQKCVCNMASYKCYMTGYTDLPVIVITPKITVMKPAKCFKRYVIVKLKSPATKWPYFVPISRVVKPVMLPLLMGGRYNEAVWKAVFVLVA